MFSSYCMQNMRWIAQQLLPGIWHQGRHHIIRVKWFHGILKHVWFCICSGVDVYTALAGATGALYGPLHGGANEVFAKDYVFICISCFFNACKLVLEFKFLKHSVGRSLLSWNAYFSFSIHYFPCVIFCHYSFLFFLPGLLQAVLKMLNEIGTVENIPEFIGGIWRTGILSYI